jgi:hypothetical protein
MEDYIYPVSLVFIALLAFSLNRNNNTKLMLIALLIGGYIIYSHETGYTATDFKNEMVDSLNEETRNFSQKKGIEGYDPQKAIDAIK